jgi:hypothetical protein
MTESLISPSRATKRNYEKATELSECAVCLSDMPMAKEEFKCLHRFCEDCTQRLLLNGNRTCPCCRSPSINFTPPRAITFVVPGRPRRRPLHARRHTLDFESTYPRRDRFQAIVMSDAEAINSEVEQTALPFTLLLRHFSTHTDEGELNVTLIRRASSR